MFCECKLSPFEYSKQPVRCIVFIVSKEIPAIQQNNDINMR